MPCFNGLAVSIHTPDGPLSEHSIQRQSRLHRITTYIPVPPAKVPANSTTGKPEQSTFAISITLLTPSLNVPYSTPKPTAEDPYPRPKIVSGLPGTGSERGKFGSSIAPYVPLTQSPNETIAAYIYFDGRVKEEVATLLRRGEETWVNSRWVSVPESEGGGLAEREFLFREVGLERWLNGLDLEGKDKDIADKIERRKQRLEKKRRKKAEAKALADSDNDSDMDADHKSNRNNGVLRYGDNKNAPVESLSADEGLFTSDSDSEDEPPVPEAAGQIKVALFRVLASGEIKRGEYSPQFDAHDDDDISGSAGAGVGEEVDHTTSFAKPKSLDPKSISTQTVTGIDPPDKPFAVFTFLYRGERQLRKMGILTPPASEAKTSTAAKRKSGGLDFSNLKPLSSAGTRNYTGYRDPANATPNAKRKGSKDKNADAMDSDADDEDEPKGADDADDDDIKPNANLLLSPEDAKKEGELEEGVRKIKLKRQHSADPINSPSPAAPYTSSTNSPTSGTPVPPTLEGALSTELAPNASLSAIANESSAPVGSPFKKQRASLPGFDDNSLRKTLNQDVAGASTALATSTGPTQESRKSEGDISTAQNNIHHQKEMDEDEEL